MNVSALRVGGGLRVAVVGGGFAGLSVAYKLAPVTKHISIYDNLPAGRAGASSVAGGLLHPLASRGVLIWKGKEGYDASRSQLLTLESQLGSSQGEFFTFPADILRPMFKENDLAQWRKAASTVSKDWLEEMTVWEFCKRTGIDPEETAMLAAMRIKNAIVVHPPRYLSALWAGVQSLCEASWHSESIEGLDAVKDLSDKHDVVVLAAGPTLQQLWSDKRDEQFFLKYVKGQNLLFHNNNNNDNKGDGDRSCANSSKRLSTPLLSGEYVVPQHSALLGHYLICGATHTHMHQPSAEALRSLMQSTELASPTHDNADVVLRQRLNDLYPHLRRVKPFAISTGVRLVTKRTDLGKIPIVGRHPTLRNVWALGGLGSRGLVYHALMAKYLTDAVLQDDEELIPKDLRPSAHYYES